MQVFKAFLIVINKHKGQMLMYIGIFVGILSAFVFSTNTEDNTYQSTKVKFAVYDYDESAESKALVEFLENRHTKKDIANDTTETIQDELYARNIDCVLRIEKGYKDAVTTGKKEEKLEVVTIPDTFASTNFESTINEYESIFAGYITAGYSSNEAINSTKNAINQEIEISTTDGGTVAIRSKENFFFTYLGWIFIVMSIIGITPVLQVFMKKDLKNRIQCSAYQYLRFNKELILGVLCTGLVICGIIIVLFNILIPGVMFSAKGGLFIVNMFCYMLVALSLAFIVSKLTANDQIINMIANILSLGMAFICGIFVPLELLSDGVIRIAHFLPAYWYNLAVQTIDKSEGEYSQILMCFGIQLLFAIAISVVAMVVDRKIKQGVTR